MKKIPFVCFVCFVVQLCLGCNSLPSDLRRIIPDGEWKTVRGQINGKFSTTKVDAADVVKDGEKLTAKEIHVRHSNPWLTNVEFDAEGYVAPAPK